MVKEAQVSGLLDPLEDYWGPSLFPRTSGVLPEPSKTYNPDDELHAIHNHLRSMSLRSPRKLLEQARAVLDGNPDLFNSEIPSHMAPKDKVDVSTENIKEYLRERRPALGHKRARFSLKPNANQLTEILEPTLDLDKLKDPEAFFMAHERMENAKREIQRQIHGVSFESNMHHKSSNARQRRPGIFGNNQRKSARYKHRYSLVAPDNKENDISSQETFEQGCFSPVNQISQENKMLVESEEVEPAGSLNMEKNKLDKILNGLLHSNLEDLREDRAVSLLQESLQIRPIILEELSLPDVRSSQITGIKSSVENFSRTSKALSDTSSLVQDITTTVPAKLSKDEKRPVLSLSLPTPPRSPFASLPLLQKHMLQLLQSKPSMDPFSDIEKDQMSAKNLSPNNKSIHEPNHVNAGSMLSFSDKFKSILINDSATEKNEVATRDFACTSKKTVEDNYSSKPCVSTGLDTGGSDVGSLDNVGPDNMDDKVVDHMHSRPDAMADDQGHQTNDLVDKVDDMREPRASEQPSGSNINLSNTLDQSSPADKASDACTREQNVPGQGVKENTEVSDIPSGKQRKGKTHSQKERKRKEVSRRQSLASAGTLWKSGVRRSTRIRTRPLEYWKGERLVYGRVHESLATVIGLKYISPAKGDGKPTMKVKSFVPDEYKELLDLAALP